MATHGGMSDASNPLTGRAQPSDYGSEGSAFESRRVHFNSGRGLWRLGLRRLNDGFPQPWINSPALTAIVRGANFFRGLRDGVGCERESDSTGNHRANRHGE
jgi:hypothetical protein